MGWAGTMGHHDGLDHLLLAMRHLVDDLGFADARCVLFGDGPAFDDTRALAAELELDDHVEFSGASRRGAPPAASGSSTSAPSRIPPIPTTTAAR